MFKYLELSKMLEIAINQRVNLKQLLYKNTNKRNHANQIKLNAVSVSYSNLSLILNNIESFESFWLDLSKRMQEQNNSKDFITNKYLLFVMVAQYLNTEKLKGGGAVKRVIMKNLDILPKIDLQSKINKKVIHIRKRNTKSLNPITSKGLQEEFSLYKPNSILPMMYDLSYEQYSSLLKKHPSFTSSPSYIVQSFSSALPPFLLFQGLLNQHNNKIKFDIIDACSAPGNKTLQLSEFLGDRGTVYAFQKDSKRFKTLQKTVEKYSASNVCPLNQDFLHSKPQNYPNVKLILLDPSCSGSGMLTNFTRDQFSQIDVQNIEKQSFKKFVKRKEECLAVQQIQRLESLHSFQLQLLRHAAKFHVSRISYSTCSIFNRQNQQVVQQFLKQNKQYRLKNVMTSILKNKHEQSIKGQQKQEQIRKLVKKGFGDSYKFCVRVDPRGKESDGFFVAIFSTV